MNEWIFPPKQIISFLEFESTVIMRGTTNKEQILQHVVYIGSSTYYRFDLLQYIYSFCAWKNQAVIEYSTR